MKHPTRTEVALRVEEEKEIDLELDKGDGTSLGLNCA